MCGLFFIVSRRADTFPWERTPPEGRGGGGGVKIYAGSLVLWCFSYYHTCSLFYDLNLELTRPFTFVVSLVMPELVTHSNLELKCSVSSLELSSLWKTLRPLFKLPQCNWLHIGNNCLILRWSIAQHVYNIVTRKFSGYRKLHVKWLRGSEEGLKQLLSSYFEGILDNNFMSVWPDFLQIITYTYIPTYIHKYINTLLSMSGFMLYLGWNSHCQYHYFSEGNQIIFT